jgi:ornithine carbamoyltransferase
VRETANMISFMADVVGIRDDMYIGKGHTYMRGLRPVRRRRVCRKACCRSAPPWSTCSATSTTRPSRPPTCWPHEHLRQPGGVASGKKLAMTWAYSPSYGKPLSVPQGMIGLMTRFGMDVTLAHPEGYDVMAGP